MLVPNEMSFYPRQKMIQRNQKFPFNKSYDIEINRKIIVINCEIIKNTGRTKS